jgi:prevent-host-death family protein
MPGVNVHDAKTHFSRLLARVERGERIVIQRGGKPVAELIPYAPPGRERVFGRDRGRISIAPDFDAPLPEFEV